MAPLPYALELKEAFNPPSEWVKIIASGVFIVCLLLVSYVCYKFLNQK